MKSISKANLTLRQSKIIEYLRKTLEIDEDSLHYYKASKDGIKNVGYILVIPSNSLPYYILSTVGFSAFKFSDSYIRCEIMMVLSKDWKVDPKELKKYDFFKFFESSIKDIKKYRAGIYPYFYFSNAKGEGFETKNGVFYGGIITFPENLHKLLNIVKISRSPMIFYEFTPLTNLDLNRIIRMGAKEFVGHMLHDKNGKALLVLGKKKDISGIEYIIKHNKDTLFGEE